MPRSSRVKPTSLSSACRADSCLILLQEAEMQAEREREHAADRAARLALREQQRRRELVRFRPGLSPKKCQASVPRSTQSSHGALVNVFTALRAQKTEHLQL